MPHPLLRPAQHLGRVPYGTVGNVVSDDQGDIVHSTYILDQSPEYDKKMLRTLRHQESDLPGLFCGIVQAY
jgi:hypothetical protein